MNQSVLHDPLQARMSSIGSEEPEDNTLNLALYYLKNADYDKVLPFAIEVSVGEELELRERMLGRLLATRMYQFAGLTKQLQYMVHTINELWTNSR